MRNTISFALLVLLLPSCSGFPADQPLLSERLEKLAPQAAGLAHVEVVDIKEVDSRPSDGPLYLDVRFRILGGTGIISEGVNIIKAIGGLRPPNAPPFKPHGPVKVDTFKKGQRYWVAFCSQYDWERYPQGVIKVWPDEDAPKLLQEAIRTDHYAHKPEYDPRSGLTHSYRTITGKPGWRVRMERDGKLLWEVKLPGEKFKGEKFEGEWRLLNREQWPSGLGHANQNRSGWYLMAETVSLLEEMNSYQLPAKKHRLTYALDADSGKTAAIWISRLDLAPTSTPSVTQYFDLNTGKVQREERFNLLEKGGLAVGAREERWLRKLVRTYDPNTGELKDEKVYHFTTSPEGSKYVPINER